MPLTRKQFELGIDKAIEEWMITIYSYLSRNRDQAFTRDELSRAVGAWEEQSVSGSTQLIYKHKQDFEKALDKLVEIGVVDVGLVKGLHYYALGHKPLDLFLESRS